MIFEETLTGAEGVVKPDKLTSYTMKLEPEREENIKRIIKASDIKYKHISKAKLLKLCIDNLVKDLKECKTEAEAIEYLRSLYKEAEF